ncbi:hypothetical protein [Klebsiella variicola]|nr:hypothetical protein [Klebsiella variicola]VAS23090.1 Uncharacterised protein [Klebsiella variicola]
MKIFFQGTRLKKAKILTVAFSFAFFTASVLAKPSQSESYNVAVYRGEAG